MRMVIGLPAMLTVLLMAVGFSSLPLAVSLGTNIGWEEENLARILAFYILFMAALAFLGNMGAGYIMSRHIHRIMRRVDQAMPNEDQPRPPIRATDEIEALGIVIDEATTTLSQMVKDSHILQNLPEAVITVDLQGRVTHLNTSASRLFKAEAPHMAGTSLVEIFPPNQSNQPFLEAVKRALEGETIPLTLMTFRMGNGPVRSYWVSMHPMEDKGDAEGNRRVSICIRNPESINAVREQIQRMERLAAVGQVAASMAHEVRNPLGSIRTFTELLGEDLPPHDPKTTYTREMLYQIDRLNQLIEEILAFSREPVTTVKEVDLQELLSRTVLLARRRLGESSPAMEEHYQENLPPMRGDPEKLQQAFLNLLINAMEACGSKGPQGKVTLRVKWEGSESAGDGAFSIRMEDTGEGISPKHLEKVFDPFFTTKPHGTGLGLSIVHNILTGHGGRVEVSSREKQGSAFHVFLPQNHHFCSPREGDSWRSESHG